MTWHCPDHCSYCVERHSRGNPMINVLCPNRATKLYVSPRERAETGETWYALIPRCDDHPIPNTSHFPLEEPPKEPKMQKEQMMLTTDEVAQRLGISAQTLANWRATGRYGEQLPFVKLGGAVRYRSADVERAQREGIVKA